MPARDMTEKNESLKLIIAEQQRDYDYLLKIYDRAGTKENVLLTASFGILAYMYYNATPSGDIAHRLFIPHEGYGIVIYVIAAAFFFFGLFKLMLNVFGDSQWETAYESSKNDYSFASTKTLLYIKDRYDKSHTTNLKSYNKRKNDLRLCFFTILVSAIILVVIKTLQ